MGRLVFENLTIGQLRKLTAEFLEGDPDFKTAQELLDEAEFQKKLKFNQK